MKKLSIAARLTIWNLAIFAVLELLFGAAMWFTLRGNLYDLVDNRVQAQIEDLDQFLRTQSAEAPVAELQQRVTEKYAQNHVADFLALYLKSGDWCISPLFCREIRPGFCRRMRSNAPCSVRFGSPAGRFVFSCSG
jgi:hypothetical protein